MANIICYCFLGLVLIRTGQCAFKYYMDTMCGQTFNFTSLQYQAMRLNLTQSSTYANNMDCILTITTGLAHHFTFTLESLAVEGCLDYLIFMDGEPTSRVIHGRTSTDGRICTGVSPVGSIYKSFGNKATLRFKSDNSNVRPGFSLDIEGIVGEPDSTGYMEYSCGQTIDFPSFNLNSFHLKLTPNTAYNHSLNCSLLFTTRSTDKFEIQINSTDIETCTSHCSCDWLDIRDGNSVQSPYVTGANGKICGNRTDLNSVYRTSGNSLYLLFISDQTDGKTGFDLTITSNYSGSETKETTLPTVTTSTRKAIVPTTTVPFNKIQDVISVNCNQNSWTIGINMDRLRQIYPDAKASNIYLGENRCTGIEFAGVLLFQQSIEDCLSGSSLHGGVFTFSNELIYAAHDPVHPFIIRHYKWTIGVECDVHANGTASGSFHNALTTPRSNSSLQYPVDVSFYLDPNFQRAVSGNPLRTATGTQVYVKVYTTTTDWNTVMKVRSCYTMPSLNATKDMEFDLIKDGCEVDTNTHIISQSTHETRFVFDAFEYSNSHDGLYVMCDALFCATSDWSAPCRQTCVPVVRRSVNKL